MRSDPVRNVRRHERARARLVGALLGLALLLVVLGLTAADRARVRDALRTIIPSVPVDAGLGEVYVRMTAGFVAAALLAVGALATWRGLALAAGWLGVVLIVPPIFFALSFVVTLPEPVAWLGKPLRVGAGAAVVATWGTWAMTLGLYMHTLIRGGFQSSHGELTEVFR